MKPSFSIIGCGKVGNQIGKELVKCGYKLVGISSKNLSSCKIASKIMNTKNYSLIPSDVTKKADIVFISTPDTVIKEVCQNIAKDNGFKKNGVVLHLSGALPSTILESSKKCGALIGSMHPLQSFVEQKDDKNHFKDIIITVEGDKKAVKYCQDITNDLGANFAEIKTDAKILYHASAVVASNYLVTILDLAFKFIKEAGVSGDNITKVLYPLIHGTLNNIEKIGIPDALTGPIARGDSEIVKQHIKEINKAFPDELKLYKDLGLKTIDIANAKGGLTKSQYNLLYNQLK